MQYCSRIRIVVAESHKLIKEGLIIILNSFHNFTVIDEAEYGFELIKKCKSNTPDIALVDNSLTDPDAITSIHHIKKENRNIKTILITATEEEQINKSKVRKICNGIISKKICPNELALAIQNVMLGDFFLFRNSIKAEEVKLTTACSIIDKLTKRENQLLYYLAKGKGSKEIADSLFLSVRTIDSHRSKIMQKYYLHSTAELLHFAHEVVNSSGHGNSNGEN